MRNVWPGNDQRGWNGMENKGAGGGCGCCEGRKFRERRRRGQLDCFEGLPKVHSGLLLFFSLPLSGHSCEGSLQKSSQSLCLSLSLAVRQSPDSYPVSFSQAISGLSGHAPKGQGLASREPRTRWQGQLSSVSTERTLTYEIWCKVCMLCLQRMRKDGCT